MSAPSSTVRKVWSMECPDCGADDQIDIMAMIDVRLTPDGTDADLAEDGSHFWEDHNPAQCRACGFAGTVMDFRLRQT